MSLDYTIKEPKRYRGAIIALQVGRFQMLS